jgi:hypothetical protein
MDSGWTNVPLLMPESMSVVNANNSSICQLVPQLVFPIDVDELIDPCQRPNGVGRYLNINLEDIRELSYGKCPDYGRCNIVCILYWLLMKKKFLREALVSKFSIVCLSSLLS